MCRTTGRRQDAGQDVTCDDKSDKSIRPPGGPEGLSTHFRGRAPATAAPAGRGEVSGSIPAHRYTVAPARGWLEGPVSCTASPHGGVVSKRVHGNDAGYDTRNDGVNATEPPASHPRATVRTDQKPDSPAEKGVSRCVGRGVTLSPSLRASRFGSGLSVPLLSRTVYRSDVRRGPRPPPREGTELFLTYRKRCQTWRTPCTQGLTCENASPRDRAPATGREPCGETGGEHPREPPAK
jgi:hypothetical protein